MKQQRESPQMCRSVFACPFFRVIWEEVKAFIEEVEDIMVHIKAAKDCANTVSDFHANVTRIPTRASQQPALAEKASTAINGRTARMPSLSASWRS